SALLWLRWCSSAPCQGAGDRPALPSGLRPRPVLRNAGRSDDGGRALGLPQKTTGLPDTPTESAPARPGSPVRFATALSTSTSPHPHLRATTQSPAATLPSPSVLRPQCPAHIGA